MSRNRLVWVDAVWWFRNRRRCKVHAYHPLMYLVLVRKRHLG